MSPGSGISLNLILSFVAAVLLLSGRAGSIPRDGPLSPEEKRGQQIYDEGISPSGREIVAVFGKDATAVAASVLTCANCHGPDGKGKPEGGVTPSDITWPALTKPYDSAIAGGRGHTAYTERHLRRAISMGLDAGGNRLQLTMPRYRIAHQDLSDLVAYLRRLGESLDVGVSDRELRIGCLLPSNQKYPEVGKSISSALTAYFDELNRKGGIFNRRIEVRFLEISDSDQESIKPVQSFLERERIFALVGSFVAGVDRSVSELVMQRRIPLIGAMTPDPSPSEPPNRYVFYLSSGLKEQSRAMVDFAVKHFPNERPSAVIVHESNPRMEELATTVAARCHAAGWTAVDQIALGVMPASAGAAAESLTQRRPDAIFFLGAAAAGAGFIRRAAELGWNPAFFAPGVLAGREVLDAPAGFNRRIFLAFPVLPLDEMPGAAAEYGQLAEIHKLSSRHLLMQLNALASAKILIEGLTRAGREVTRETLLQKVEGLYRFQTGFAAPVTYSPNRRVGVIGAYIVTVDLSSKRFLPVSTFLEPGDHDKP